MIAASRAIGGAAVLKITPKADIKKAVARYRTARSGLHTFKNRNAVIRQLFPTLILTCVLPILGPYLFSILETKGNIKEAIGQKRASPSLVARTTGALMIGAGALGMSVVFGGALSALPSSLSVLTTALTALPVLSVAFGFGILLADKGMRTAAQLMSVSQLKRALKNAPGLKDTILAEIGSQGLPTAAANKLTGRLQISKGVVV